jgi:hemerythrin-like domain-containing protein
MKTSPEADAGDAPISAEDEALADALSQHHRGLERALDTIVVKAQGDDSFVLGRAWHALKRELLLHMDIEERALLPPFENCHSEEALALRREHDAIREELFNLGVALDLHQLRAEAVAEFAARLRDHARRESQGLYPWIARHLPHERWLVLEQTLLANPGDAGTGGGSLRS